MQMRNPVAVISNPPALVKLPSMPYLPVLMDIIAQGYPFNTSG
ncbi:hypothetical protein [Citrobacter sp. U14242]